MIIDTKHELARYTKVYDASGNLIPNAVRLDTEKGEAAVLVKNGEGRFEADPDGIEIETSIWDQEKETMSRTKVRLRYAVVSGVKVKFENVPDKKKHLIPPGF